MSRLRPAGTRTCRTSVPELPDITVYVEALASRVRGSTLERVRLASPFVLRSFDPPISEAHGRAVTGLRRLGKRIVFALEGDLYLSIHLMIAGRLHWKPGGAKVPGKVGLAAFDFSRGTLTLTEAGTKKRAALRGDARHALRLDRAPAAGRGRRVPRGRDGLQAGDGRPRPLRQALPRLRRVRPAHPARGQRDQLLRQVP